MPRWFAGVALLCACGDRTAPMRTYTPDPDPGSLSPEREAAPDPEPVPEPDPVELDTFLDEAPGAGSTEARPRFLFHANLPGARFECRLDRAAFRDCESPHFVSLDEVGPYTFEVRAALDGKADTTPARHAWDVANPYPDVAIVFANDAWYESNGEWFPEGERLDLAGDFYDTHEDVYDWLILWTERPVPDPLAFALPVAFDIAGIGFEYWDMVGENYARDAGSAGRLQALAVMNQPEFWDQPWVRAWTTAEEVLGQEVGHRWLAYFQLPWEDDPFALLCPAFGVHWNMFVGFDRPSAVGRSITELTDRGDGTFVADTAPASFSSLDLYAMGLLPPEEVADFFWVRDPYDFDPPLDPTGWEWNGDSPVIEPVTFAGERVDVSLGQIIDSLGERDPPVGVAPTVFRQAFVLLITPGGRADLWQLQRIDEIRRSWEIWFADATRGRGTVITTLAP